MLEKFKYARSPSQMRNAINDSNITATEQQQEAFEEFLSALEDLQIGIGDLGRPANWGVWNNKLYIIDFGYDTSTENLYRGTELATAFVDKNGDISLNIRKQAPKNRW
jgi:hypothetical protein